MFYTMYYIFCKRMPKIQRDRKKAKILVISKHRITVNEGKGSVKGSTKLYPVHNYKETFGMNV